MSGWSGEPGRDVPSWEGGGEVTGWDPPGQWYGRRWDEPLEPRWSPDRPLAERITRRGRWQDVDPLRRGGVWSRYKLATLAGYLALVGGAYARAWSEQRRG
jgi:hypothetical protein